jgi:predicted transcriptional regulator
MKLSDVMKALDAELLVKDISLDVDVPCAFGSDLISDILMCTKESTLLLTGITNPQIIRLSDMIELTAIVFVRGKRPAEDVVKMARQRKLPLLTTKYTMYQSSGVLYNLGLRSCKI